MGSSSQGSQCAPDPTDAHILRWGLRLTPSRERRSWAVRSCRSRSESGENGFQPHALGRPPAHVAQSYEAVILPLRHSLRARAAAREGGAPIPLLRMLPTSTGGPMPNPGTSFGRGARVTDNPGRGRAGGLRSSVPSSSAPAAPRRGPRDDRQSRCRARRTFDENRTRRPLHRELPHGPLLLPTVLLACSGETVQPTSGVRSTELDTPPPAPVAGYKWARHGGN